KRAVLVLQPLGPVDASLLARLSQFMSAYFDTRVRVAAALPIGSKGRRVREEGGRKWVQAHTGTLIEQTLAPRLPADAVAMLGITLEDLYPEASWNFVFGEASLEERVGVYSLNRYFPREGRPTTDEWRLGMLRSFKVLAHETGHMFGL